MLCYLPCSASWSCEFIVSLFLKRAFVFYFFYFFTKLWKWPSLSDLYLILIVTLFCPVFVKTLHYHFVSGKVHKLYPNQVPTSSLPKLQSAAMSHLQPAQHKPTCSTDLPSSNSHWPSPLLHTLLPTRDTSPLHSRPEPVHTCAPHKLATPSLPNQLHAPSSSRTTGWTSAAPVPPSATPCTVGKQGGTISEQSSLTVLVWTWIDPIPLVTADSEA